MRINATLVHVRVIIHAVWGEEGGTVGITYSECMSVALVIQHAKRMRRIVLFVTCLVVPYFSTLSHKWHDFRGKSY